jgi:ubiquinone biosynthesis protein
VLRPLLQAKDSALVHGDPHAGNLMVLDEERFGLLDWSLAAQLSKEERVLIVQAVLAGLQLDRKRLARAMAGLTETVHQQAEFDGAVADAIRRVHRGELPGIGWLVELIDDLVMRGAVRFPPNLLVLRKSWVALGGVLLTLDPDFSPESELAKQIVLRALRELPRRWFSLPFSRGFSNHLSNFDLLRLTASGPRFLRNFWRELLAS